MFRIWYAVFPMREEVIENMKKLLTVAAVTLMASGAAIAGTLSYGFINDDGGVVSGDPVTPPVGSGTATFVRVGNTSGSAIDLTAVLTSVAGAVLNTNTGSLAPGGFFSWRPRQFQGFVPSGSGATENGNMTIFHDGSPGDLNGNVVVISSNGSRLGFLIQEQI